MPCQPKTVFPTNPAGMESGPSSRLGSVMAASILPAIGSFGLLAIAGHALPSTIRPLVAGCSLLGALAAWHWALIRRRNRPDEFRRLVQFSVDKAAFSVLWLDSEGQIVYSNEAACEQLGYSAQELLSLKVWAINPDYPPERYLAAWKKIQEQGSICVESRHRQKDGQIIPVEIVVRLVEFDGRPLACSFSREISERKAAEAAKEALRVDHCKSEIFINSVPSILIGLDAEGRIERWNLAAANTFGLPEADVRGKALSHCGVAWVGSDIERELDSWKQLTRPLRRDNLPFDKNGSRRFLGLSISPVKFQDAIRPGLLITGADTTERRHLEEQLRQAQKLEAIGQLAAGIAHEINTPTQYVSDNTTFVKESWPAISELLRQARAMHEQCLSGTVMPDALERFGRAMAEADLDYLLEEIPQAIAHSIEGVKRVAKIVRAMKEFSHPDSGEKCPVDLNRAIETTITVARNEWKYVADVVTELDPELPPVPCHGGEFNQVILNLIVNAAHAIRENLPEGSKGQITIRTRATGDSVEVSIRDTGKGIPEAIRPRIFEPFFTTKEVGKGTGQGLTLAHTVIVKKHAGKIWFESEEGKGTTFFVRLPIGQPVPA
jgi:PAS domain S-box-containing protein